MLRSVSDSDSTISNACPFLGIQARDKECNYGRSINGFGKSTESTAEQKKAAVAEQARIVLQVCLPLCLEDHLQHEDGWNPLRMFRASLVIAISRIEKKSRPDLCNAGPSTAARVGRLPYRIGFRCEQYT